MLRSIAIANHKGGVGKSTTTINLGAALVRLGKRVLLIDSDAQGHTTIGLNIVTTNKLTLSELLCTPSLSCNDVIQKTYIPNLDIIPSDISLLAAESTLASLHHKELILRNKLIHLAHDYDYVIFDCPPTFGTIPLNVFTCAHEIILPLQLHYFSLAGVNNFIETINFINRELYELTNHTINISGVLLTFFDARTKLARAVHTQIKDIFGDKVFATSIPQNIKLNEAQSHGLSIFDYDSKCKGSVAYMNLAREVLTRGIIHEQHQKNEPRYNEKVIA